MGVGAGLSMYVVVVQKFTFAISSPDEFLSLTLLWLLNALVVRERLDVLIMLDFCLNCLTLAEQIRISR